MLQLQIGDVVSVIHNPNLIHSIHNGMKAFPAKYEMTTGRGSYNVRCLCHLTSYSVVPDDITIDWEQIKFEREAQ